MRPHSLFGVKNLQIIKSMSDIYMKTRNIYLEQLLLKMNFRRNRILCVLGPPNYKSAHGYC